MKINLNYQFKDVSGKEFNKFVLDKDGNATTQLAEIHHMAKCLAHALFHWNDQNMKFSLWYEELYKTGSIEIDKDDLELLIAWIEAYKPDPQKTYLPFFAQNGIRRQVTDTIKRQKEKQEKK